MRDRQQRAAEKELMSSPPSADLQLLSNGGFKGIKRAEQQGALPELLPPASLLCPW